MGILDNLRILKIHILLFTLRRAEKAIGSGISSWSNKGLLHNNL